MDKSQSKFKVGDRVRISKKYRTSYNSITNTGIVTKVDYEGARNKYTVQWEGKAFKQRYYSYELDKAGEQDVKKNDAQKTAKTLPIVMVHFRPQDQVRRPKYKVGDKVYVANETVKYVTASGFDKDEVAKLHAIQTIEKVGYEHGRVIYKLKGIDTMHFHEAELFTSSREAANQPGLYTSSAKFAIGSKVLLKKEVADRVVARLQKSNDNTPENVKIVRGPHEVVSVNFPPGQKVEYYIEDFRACPFSENELEQYPEKRIEADAKRLEYARKSAWVGICNVYLFQFCKRHGYRYDPDAWVSSDPGTSAEVSDMFVSMDDIRYDVDNKIDPELFSKWYWKSLEIYELTDGKVSYMNYPSFCKGAPDEFTPERMEKLRVSKKRMDEAQKDFEETVHQYVEQSGHEQRKKLF